MGSRLEGFLVRQSPRLDLECIETLARECGGGLKQLRLSECGKMEGEWMGVLAKGGLRKLEMLDLSYPLNPLPSGCEELEELIVAVGPNLVSLNLAGQSLLTSKDLFALLPNNLPVLTRLDLTLLPFLTELDPIAVAALVKDEEGVKLEDGDEDEENQTVLGEVGMVEVFNAWEQAGNVGLESVKMGKAHLLKGLTLQALVRLAGETLRELEITGWKDVDEEVVKGLGRSCKGVTRMDLGWCSECSSPGFVLETRGTNSSFVGIELTQLPSLFSFRFVVGSVTDFTLKEIFEDAEHLQEVVVWGESRFSFLWLESSRDASSSN